MNSTRSSQRRYRQCLASLGIGVFFAVSLGSFLYGADVFAADPPTFIAPHLNTPIPGLNFKDHPIIIDPKEGTAQITFLSAYVGAAYRYLLGVSVVAAAVMIVWGGFKYIMGSVSDVQDGKNIIKDALVGLVLIFGSFTILATLNPGSLTELKPLTVKYINQEIYELTLARGQGVPVEKMRAWDKPELPAPGQAYRPPPSPPPQATPESGSGDQTPAPVVQAGCGAAGPYRFPPSPCSGQEGCKQFFCTQKKYDFPGAVVPTTLVGFETILPESVGEQVSGFGLAMVPPGGACFGKCSSDSFFKTITYGPKAKQSMKNLMIGSRSFLPEVRDALVKAGAEAKKRGYFIVIRDGTRTIQGQATEWCRRIQESGSPKGMATPGSSPHELGVGVDVALMKAEGGKMQFLTTTSDICGQVETQQALGPQNLAILEEIMASAGFRHMCSEVWHFNYLGVYEQDCTTCAFPGKMLERVQKDKTCK